MAVLRVLPWAFVFIGVVIVELEENVGLFDMFRGGSAEVRFWEWFANNSARLSVVKTCREPVCNELYSRMRKVNKNLVFSFGPVEDGRREFVVSADGIRSVFPSVRKLVAAAPEISGWRITAFRPPTGTDHKIRIDNRDICADDVWFAAKPRGNQIDLALFIRGLERMSEKAGASLVFLMLDHALGEYDVETKLAGLGYYPLPYDPASQGLRPFQELPDTVKKLTNGYRGS